MPSTQEARSRQTAYEVERHWWSTRIEKRAEMLRACQGMQTLGEWAQIEADWLESLLNGRVK